MITNSRKWGFSRISIGDLQWRRGDFTNLHDFPALDGDFPNLSTQPLYVCARFILTLIR
jgi:hypothetical protein